MERKKEITTRDEFIKALDATVKQFKLTGTVEPQIAAEMAFQVMLQLGVQKTGYEAVEEALVVHYGSKGRSELESE